MPFRVLIVDDDRAALDGLAQLLTAEGYGVLTAETYGAAQTALGSQHPDLLLIDIRLRDFNGLQLIATPAQRVPAIVMTGYPDTVLERDARAFGAEYLVKPIDPQTLLAMVDRLLESRHRGQGNTP